MLLGSSDKLSRWIGTVLAAKMMEGALAPEVTRLLHDADPDVARSAAIAIGQLGGATSVPDLQQALSDEEVDLSVRCCSALSLGRLACATSIPTLLALYGKRDTRRARAYVLRCGAAIALEKIDPSLAMKVLNEDLCSLDDDIYIEAMAVLRHLILSLRPTSDMAMEYLLHALANVNDTIRLEAALLLSTIDDPRCEHRLGPLLKSDNLAIRNSAHDVLLSIRRSWRMRTRPGLLEQNF